MANESDLAREYEATSFLQTTPGLAFVSGLSISKGDKVLDIGCGTGSLTKELAGIVGPEGCVVALDNDVERVKVAKSINGASNLEYVEGRGEDPFPGGEYDLIFSNYVFHWIERMDLVFQNAYNSLKVGGRLAFITVAPHDVAGICFTPSSMVSQELQSRVLENLHHREDTELKQLASDNHFELVSFVREERQTTLEHVDAFIHFLRVTLYTGKVFDDTHFNRSEILNHFGTGCIVFNDPIYKAIFVKKNLSS